MTGRWGIKDVDVLGAVREAVEGDARLEPGAGVVVGVSGGPDSLCLLHVLNRLQPDYGWSLHVAHLNHRLRGAQADEDMIFVGLLAMDWELPCVIAVVDVAGVAERRGMSVEEAARQVRYGFMADVTERVDAAAVAVGHSADDQSETVLMHILRGTGLAGLRGMAPALSLADLRLIRDGAIASTADVRLVRPLLSVSRAEIERYCRDHRLAPRFDRSNLDVTYFRNRLRHELLPLLETYNPNIKALLRRTAAVAAADYELIAARRDAAWDALVQQETDAAIDFELAGWRALPLALQRATLRRAAYELRPHLRDVDFVHVEQAVEVANHGVTGAQATLPQGLRLTLGYDTLRLSEVGAAPAPPDWPLLWRDELLPVVLPGRTALPDSPWRLDARPWEGRGEVALSNAERWTAYLDEDRLGPDLLLRPRRPGDRFQPLGMGGHTVGVADFMINAKIPARWRAHVPLLVHTPPGGDGAQEIAWLVGWRIDERVKITAGTERVVRLRFEREVE